MSTPSESSELTPRARLPLREHAAQMLALNPEGPLPDGGRPYPDDPDPPRAPERGKRAEQSARLRAMIDDFLAAADTSPRALDALQERLRESACREGDIGQVLESLSVQAPDRTRELALSVLRAATERRAVWLALGLLKTTGLRQDAEEIRTLGVLACFATSTVTTLAAIEGSTADVIWLAERIHPRHRAKVIIALCRRSDPPARSWLLRAPLAEHFTAASTARKIAEAVDLPAALAAARNTGEEGVADQALRLLALVAGGGDYRDQLSRYPAARAAYGALAEHRSGLTASLGNCALLHALIIELDSGHSRLLDWAPGEREQIRKEFSSLLQQADWLAPVAQARAAADQRDHWRAEWIDRMAKQTPDTTIAAPQQFAVVIVCPDPARPGGAETRILVDGRPVIAEAFDRGGAHSPDVLLERKQLRASAQPREVQLAEADCTEGCCGALYVTIVRESDTVRWYGWRTPDDSSDRSSTPGLTDLRFDAVQYDAELARAESDSSWEWTGQTTARLLRQHLRERPDLLARWNCSLNWVTTHHHARDQVELSFSYPEQPYNATGMPWLQFIWSIPDDGTPPERQAEAAWQRLAEADPTTYARVAGGSQASAEALGFPWPPRDRPS